MRKFILVLIVLAGNVATLQGCSASKSDSELTAEEAAAMIELRRELDRLQSEYAELSVEKFRR